ncbi:site-specific DNA-methyltransferase [Mesorhizobium sp.]|uniref:site-specific DNA-methyltransferase n=1 Tax=Mesorhizobium sp. TaxID=1871066 RepID=UPI0011F52326|nr:site-specific DNA-methyltransferase [Mesorhizobium sp.]TIQ03831.1 MAG: site-specific DNA-methyltransferase [Mesorhizobium sp.]
MSDSLAELILTLTPEDGSSINNGAMLTLLRAQVPSLSDDAYVNARDTLVDEGVLGRGRGRGGSIFRIVEQAIDEDEDSEDSEDLDEDGDGFELLPPEESASTQRRRSTKRSARSSGEPIQVLSYRHGETRVNNPEVGMVHAGTDPDGDKTAWAYDPHLDPMLNFDSARSGIERLIDEALASDDLQQMKDALTELKRLQQPYLNWTGKAEGTSFEVDTVSLHVHERVDPATILANVARRLKGKDAGTQWRQPDLFAAPFENLPLRQALDFYSHEKGWSNRLVAGDSLLVMNSLLAKESMARKVQMVYIDPPYGIKYGSNFQPFTSKREVKDRSDGDLTQEPEMIKAFRDTWELGIHSYLTYLRDRLVLAKELLSESGSIFVQISDENAHHVRELLDEVFGSQNRFPSLIFRKTTGAGSPSGYVEAVPQTFDYLLWYGKERSSTKFNRIFLEKDYSDDVNFKTVVGDDGVWKPVQRVNGKAQIRSGERLLRQNPITSQSGASTTQFPTEFLGQTFTATKGGWKTNVSGMQRLRRSGRLVASGKTLGFIRYSDDFGYQPVIDIWDDTRQSGFGEQKVYVVQTAFKVIERCLLMTTAPGDLVLDPTCGSGTTAFVAEKWGRRWITCDTSRVAITLAKQRLMTAGFDYYALRYPHEGLKGGFDYVTVPHVTLKSIANNPDIDTIYDENHTSIETALDRLNDALSAAPPKSLKPAYGVRKGRPVDFAKRERLHEWEVPFNWPDDWPEVARTAFNSFHTARIVMQRRMDESIADHAEQETLYDRPRIDQNRLRIAGPFSVEAVPAPTVLSLDDSLPPAEANESIARSGETSRQSLWRDELLKTGVRGKAGAMLTFAEFETLPGLKHIHASGSLAETGERVVVSFGPEHAALEQRQVELALSEAETLRPGPKFILFCAFAFDPEAAKDIDEVNWPGVTLLKAQMNTDLLTEDLKKARSSNQSFWLMGQPDVELRKRGDGMWQVEVNGFDYFDPKAGDLVSGGKKQIAMWSLDTDYDQRSLMPHQVFFPMADAKGGWNRLKTTIRSELDEDLLEQFHGTVSLPFAAGDNRRIAVKIVDDRGIESLKIMPLEG